MRSGPTGLHRTQKGCALLGRLTQTLCNDQMKPSGELLGLSIFSTAILLAAVIFLTSVIPDFAAVFESFKNRDNDLPLLTKMVLSTYKSWWLFPLASFLLGIVAYKRKSISAKTSKSSKRYFLGRDCFGTNVGFLYRSSYVRPYIYLVRR